MKDKGTRIVIFVVCSAGKFVAFAEPSVCVHQKNATIVGPHQALSQFVYKKRETVFGSHQLPPQGSSSCEPAKPEHLRADTKVPAETLGKGFEVSMLHGLCSGSIEGSRADGLLLR